MPDPDPAAAPRVAPDGATSLTLLQRLRAADSVAWVRLVHLYDPLVRMWVGRGGVTGADVDDAAQEVFLEVSKGLPAFRRDRPGDTFRGWVHGITRHVLMRKARRSHRQPAAAAGGTEAQRLLNDVVDATPDVAEPDNPEWEKSALYHRGLELVRGEFEPRSWRAFWEHVVGGRTPADVAAEIGVSSAAVRQAKSRVLRRLREELGDLIE
jgi:RNA polymerase sigma-70 factor (ECF subfamily)